VNFWAHVRERKRRKRVEVASEIKEEVWERARKKYAELTIDELKERWAKDQDSKRRKYAEKKEEDWAKRGSKRLSLQIRSRRRCWPPFNVSAEVSPWWLLQSSPIISEPAEWFPHPEQPSHQHHPKPYYHQQQQYHHHYCGHW
jgi:hypothetical protein